MKNTSVVSVLVIFLLGYALPSSAQVTLPEVTIKAVRYKYLSAVDNQDVAQPVRMLERQAAEYDVKETDYYEDEYDNYFVSFYIPQGSILAAYDKDGRLIRTAEKYSDIGLPQAVREAVVKRFPNWSIAKDAYLVTYNEDKGAKKVYKILLKNGDKRMKVKANENGEFL